MAEVLFAGVTGGREHALGAELMNEGEHNATWTHGGNAGTRLLGKNIGLTDPDQIADYAESHGIDLTVIGPEAPLVAGLADKLRARGITTFGPGADGAELEASKSVTAEFCEEFGLPQPDYMVIDDKFDPRLHDVYRQPQNYVLKADGLAGGKGVKLPKDDAEASRYVEGMMTGNMFGDAGKRIVVQRRLNAAGPEMSVMYVLDGQGDFTILPLAQDHKLLLDGDKGDMTGGVGAYAPMRQGMDSQTFEQMFDIGDRLADGLQRRGIDYRGAAFVGKMRDVDDGNRLKVLEINVRLGDPETQVIMKALGAVGIDGYQLFESAARGKLDRDVAGRYLGEQVVDFASHAVCLSAAGYPNAPQKGAIIHGLDKTYEGVTVYHGGATFDPDLQQVYVSGGRALYVTGVGKSIDEAAARSYAAIGTDAIHFDGMQYRTDIGWQARTTK